MHPTISPMIFIYYLIFLQRQRVIAIKIAPVLLSVKLCQTLLWFKLNKNWQPHTNKNWLYFYRFFKKKTSCFEKATFFVLLGGVRSEKKLHNYRQTVSTRDPDFPTDFPSLNLTVNTTNLTNNPQSTTSTSSLFRPLLDGIPPTMSVKKQGMWSQNKICLIDTWWFPLSSTIQNVQAQ